MCDTLCATPSTTSEHVMLFGKNSDRQRNEAQGLEYRSRAWHASGSRVECTYISIPQARQTHAVLLSRPYWIWGAEMGANEHGVVAGNETVYSKSPAPEEPSLIGMDFVRLALERATTAQQALEVMTTLLARYGQGGDCGHMTPYYYNNSFLVADPSEAFVLETVGREWLVERVKGVRTISNCYSIGAESDSCSAGLHTMMAAAGWNNGSPPNYADALAERQRESLGQGRERRERSTEMLHSRVGELRVENFASALRDHGPTAESEWTPRVRHPFGLCIHAGDDGLRAQTTAALISELRVGNSVHWVTGTAAPCLSIFKPVLLDVPLPVQESPPTGQFDARTLWWRHELLHRAVLQGDLPRFLREIKQERDALEAEFGARIRQVLNGGSAVDHFRVVSECWQQAANLEDVWSHRLIPNYPSAKSPYDSAWSKMSKVAGIPGIGSLISENES